MYTFTKFACCMHVLMLEFVKVFGYKLWCLLSNPGLCLFFIVCNIAWPCTCTSTIRICFLS